MRPLATLRHAARSLTRRPAFSVTAILLLALGIGANTAIFSLVEGVLFGRLPWPEPGRLVAAWEVSQRGNEMASAWGNFLDWQKAERLESLAAYAAQRTTVLGGDEPALASVTYVSADFFRTLGIVPLHGRLTVAEDHRAGAAPVALVSRSFFERQLGGDARRLGRQRLEVGGGAGEVVGVIDDALAFPEGTEIWVPLELFDPQPVRTAHNYRVVGRLAPGASLEAAAAELDAKTKAIVSDEPKDYLPAGARLRSLGSQITGAVERPLWVLLAATGLVLLVACSNLAASLLARQVERRSELTVRSWLGASRARLLAQPLAESLLLATAGGGLGLLLAAALVEYLTALAPASLPHAERIGLNPVVLAFAGALTLLTALLFGVAPGLSLFAGKSARPGTARTTAAKGELKGWSLLVGAEIALTLVLMVGAGLLLRTLSTILRQPLGLKTDQIATVSLNLPQPRYADDAAIARYHEQLLAEVAALPGVRQVGFTSAPPLTGQVPTGQMGIAGGPKATLDSGYHAISPRTFQTLGIPLLAGRDFSAGDRAGAEFVAIVNRSFAEAAWPGGEALGKRVNAAGMDQFWQQEVWATVIGVVADARLDTFTTTAGPQAFFPVAQRPQGGTSGALLVATQGKPEALWSALDHTLGRIDDQIPFRFGTLAGDAARTLGQRRFALKLLGAFAAVALLLSGIGIAGVVSYAVARRRRELGLRLALGSLPAAAERLVVGGFLKVVAVGLAAGLALSLGLTRFLSTLLWGVEPTDPATFAGTTALLLAVAALAAYLPARKAARIPPAEVLRGE